MKEVCSLFIVTLPVCACLIGLKAAAQNGNAGFENNSTTGWTNDGTGVPSFQNNTVRTGVFAGTYTTASSVNQRWRNDGNNISVPAGNYVHYIIWVNPSTAGNLLSAGINLNGNFAGTGTAKPAGAWSQLSFSRQNTSGVAVTSWGYVNTQNGGTGTVSNRIDDGVIYTTTTSAIDLTKPAPPSNFVVETVTSDAVTFTWTIGADAGTGLQATLILRTASSDAAGVPELNDQGVYAVTGGADGPNTIKDANNITWNVIATTVPATATSFTDNSIAANTTYRYAVIHRDLAYNYSVALLSSTIAPSQSIAPPEVTAGSATLIETTFATLNGTVNPNNAATVVSFDYGSTTAYGLSVPALESPVSGSTGVAVTKGITGLAFNTVYNFRLSGTNSAGMTRSTNESFCTLAATPAPPVVSSPSPAGLVLSIGSGDGNPAGTVYAIEELTTGNFVQANGRLGTNAAWQTALDWGTTSVVGLNSLTTYTFSVKAKNFAGVETAFSNTTSGTTLACSSVPAALVVSNITNSGATITWSGGSNTEFELAVLTSSTPPPFGNLVTTSTTEFVSGLLSTTTYYVHVRSKCGSAFSAWVTSEPFTTALSPLGLVTWVPAGQSNFGATPFLPTTVDSRITVSGLSRGAGVSTGTQVAAAANAWGGYDWQGAPNQDVVFTLTPNGGYRLKLTSFQLSYRTSPTGPGGGTLSYAIDNGSFNPIAAFTFAGGTAGNSAPEVDLSAIAGLQNIVAGTVITFRLMPTGGQALGTWYLFNEGLVINGTISTTLPPPVTDAAAPVHAHCFTANWSPSPDATGYNIDVYKDGFSLDPNTRILAGWNFKTGFNANLGNENNREKMLAVTGAANLSIASETARAEGWQNGNGFWEVAFSTTGFYNLKLASKQRSSATGPRDFKIQYRIGTAGNYADIAAGKVPSLADNYTSGTVSNLPLPAACDNQPLVYIRWTMTSNTSVSNTTVASVGASNIDDIMITGNTGLATTEVPGFTNLPVGNINSVQVTGLTPGTKYYYVVRAIAAGILSQSSNVTTVVTSDQSTAHFRSRKGGKYSDPATWEYDPGCNMAWIPATTPPSSKNNITVSSGHTVTLDLNSVVLNRLILQSGATLSLSGNSLTVNGGISGEGAFIGSSEATLILGGDGGTVNFIQTAAGSDNALGNLTITGGTAKLGTPLNVYGELNIQNGTLDLDQQSLILKSSEAQTARVSEIKGILVGETNVTVERYLSASGGSFNRLLTAPVVGVSINASWQEGRVFNGSTYVLTGTGTTTTESQRAEGTQGVKYGTLINGQKLDAATANSKGFDTWSASPGYNASIRYYLPNAAGTPTPDASSFIVTPPLDNTLDNTAFDNCRAYMLWIWGARSPVPPSFAQQVVTLRAKGRLKQGTYTVNVPGDKAYTLVGNPYAAPLDFQSLYTDNAGAIKPYFWVWMPTAANYNVLVSPTGSGAYEYVPAPLSPTGVGGTAQNRVLHSAQGFFVVPATTSTANQITIKETHKAASALSPGLVGVMRQVGREDLRPAKLYINLSAVSGGDKRLLDGGLARYHASYTTEDDIVKMPGSAEKLSLPKGGRELIIRSGALPKGGDSLQVLLTGTAQQKSYLLEVLGANFAVPGLQAVLIDRYGQKETPLSLGGAITSYSFTVDQEPASRDPLRFVVVYRAVQQTPLPLVLSHLSAEAVSGGVAVRWSVEDESGIRQYEVERSTDGTFFAPLTTVAARGGSGPQAYSTVDARPAAVTYYRVKLVGTAGEVKYSGVVKIEQGPGGEGLVLYPNPVSTGAAVLQLVNKAQGRYRLALFNSLGQPVWQQTLQHPGGTHTYPLQIHHLAAGTYRVEIQPQNGKTEHRLLQVLN